MADERVTRELQHLRTTIHDELLRVNEDLKLPRLASVSGTESYMRFRALTDEEEAIALSERHWAYAWVVDRIDAMMQDVGIPQRRR